MIEVERLTKDYGTVVAVSDLSFSVARGEVVGFLGPNGAGKSTTLRILAGFLGQTSGTVRIDGIDILEDPIGARRRIGYMPEAAPLYPEMRVREYLAFRARLKGVARREVSAAVGRSMEQAAVSDVGETLIGHLSKGYRQRVGLADALVSRPPLLILDEPTAGLDPNQIREVRKLVEELGRDHTLLLSTHILPEVESTCSRAVVIDRGRLVVSGSIDELRARRRSRAAAFVVTDRAKAAEVVRRSDGVASVAEDGPVGDGLVVELTVQAEGPEVVERVVAALVASGVGVREARLVKPSLEEVFAQLTGADGAAPRPLPAEAADAPGEVPG